jgi:Domain of unknown function (DUF397)
MARHVRLAYVLTAASDDLRGCWVVLTQFNDPAGVNRPTYSFKGARMGQVESSTLGWRKSSRCDSGTCVEVAWRTEGVAVRDNTVLDVHLTFDEASWRCLVRDLRGGLIGG